MVLAWFAQYVSRKLKAHGSLVAYVSGIKKLHLYLGYSTKGFKGFQLHLTLMGLKGQIIML